MEMLRSEHARSEARNVLKEPSLADLILSRKAGASKTGSPGLNFDTKHPETAIVNDKGPVHPNTAVLRGFEAALSSAKALGLPADYLSTYILSFARVFSLKIDIGLFQKIRTEVLRSSREEKDAAFAAILAASKGTELNAAGIDSFISALDPDSSGNHNPEDQNPHHDNPEKETQDRDSSEPLSSENDVSVLAKEIQQSFVAFNAHSRVFNHLNRLTDKEGKHWIVFPLTQTHADVEIHALVRLLLVPNLYAVERLLVELDTKRRFWSFDMEKLGQAGASICISADPEISASESTLSKAFSEMYGKMPLQVRISSRKALRFTDELVSDYKSVVEEA